MLVPIVADFETEAIEPRPYYPPRPVGVAIRWPGRKTQYHAWGHPTENNCTFDDARRRLRSRTGNSAGSGSISASPQNAAKRSSARRL